MYVPSTVFQSPPEMAGPTPSPSCLLPRGPDLPGARDEQRSAHRPVRGSLDSASASSTAVPGQLYMNVSYIIYTH